jgi:hypothetical protein
MVQVHGGVSRSTCTGRLAHITVHILWPIVASTGDHTANVGMLRCGWQHPGVPSGCACDELQVQVITLGD